MVGFASAIRATVRMSVHLKLEEAKYTGLLHLAQRRLRNVPTDLFRLNYSALYRLDLGFNHIQTIPDAIGQLTSLDALWLNDNPITSLPPSIYKCANLQVLDVNRTALTDLPCEMGRLTQLTILDMEDVPLRPKLLAAATADPANVCGKTLAYLHRKDVRRRQKQELYDKLKDGPYLESADSNEGQAMIQSVMKRVLKEFQTEEDVKSLIRNIERLFPASLIKAQDPTTAASVRAAFMDLKRDNEKKKLAAELELKIRNIYFDCIDPSTVEPMVAVSHRCRCCRHASSPCQRKRSPSIWRSKHSVTSSSSSVMLRCFSHPLQTRSTGPTCERSWWDCKKTWRENARQPSKKCCWH
ncbi:hypothetical protein, variant 3 [Aphanomyces invadans]|uniref:Uncharacterized protein n=1 Tax=Aphanomyces invadans TaxID=157072 RepID=A0A024T8M2_9STRA|nr:hypothetical protein, variant 2 [Aphanomyces invadans]XP_008881003.1 hypothetical protein, variant 3 [Aphanomyces invadans]ETV90368.1 hypothetical protein, variant 2 [Aphanomyces invadans]ETV90369.1 hypothetical protein, variant 3 [Aphanomyces invadans]|eukprot:XP_008881002.1 hypothetical protein, variant 2 [Aphanomyces invadans]